MYEYVDGNSWFFSTAIYDALMTTYLCILRVVTHCHLNDVHHIVTYDDDDAPSRYGDVTRTEESFKCTLYNFHLLKLPKGPYMGHLIMKIPSSTTKITQNTHHSPRIRHDAQT